MPKTLPTIGTVNRPSSKFLRILWFRKATAINLSRETQTSI